MERHAGPRWPRRAERAIASKSACVGPAKDCGSWGWVAICAKHGNRSSNAAVAHSSAAALKRRGAHMNVKDEPGLATRIVSSMSLRRSTAADQRDGAAERP